MTRKHTLTLLLLTALLTLSTACIRVEYDDCPPLRLQVVVKDKNYYNVNKVDLEDARPEDLPFRDYVPNLTYTVRNASTGETVAEKTLFDVPEDITTYEILLPEDLPFGDYVVDVWGGISNDEPLAAIGLPLHPDGIVGGDPYHVHQSLTYDYRHASYTLEMERVKGKLIIETEHLPTVATQSDNSITQIRSLCAPDFVYSGSQKLTRHSDWTEQSIVDGAAQGTAEYRVWKTILAPSTADKATVLKLNFKDNAGTILERVLPKDVNITMHRNSLTVLRYVWAWIPDEQQYGWIIYILINDNWEVYHEMIVD